MRKKSKPVTTTPKKSLAEYAYQALIAEGGPLHSSELAKRMEAAGWPAKQYAKPAHVVYTTLFGQIGRHGDTSLFRFLGAGTFVAADTLTKTHVDTKPVPPPKNQKKLATPRSTETPTQEVPADATCIGCKFIEFTGINELTLRQGVCGRYDASGRMAVYPKTPACQNFQPATGWQKEKRRREQGLIRLKVLTFNLQCSRTRRL